MLGQKLKTRDKPKQEFSFYENKIFIYAFITWTC